MKLAKIDFWTIQLQITQKSDVLGKFCGQICYQRHKIYQILLCFL